MGCVSGPGSRPPPASMLNPALIMSQCKQNQALIINRACGTQLCCSCVVPHCCPRSWTCCSPAVSRLSPLRSPYPVSCSPCQHPQTAKLLQQVRPAVPCQHHGPPPHSLQPRATAKAEARLRPRAAGLLVQLGARQRMVRQRHQTRLLQQQLQPWQLLGVLVGLLQPRPQVCPWKSTYRLSLIPQSRRLRSLPRPTMQAR